MELSKIKNYLKIDDDITEDDDLIIVLQKSAIEFAESTTNKQYSDEDNLYSLLVLQLINHWYNNRILQNIKPGAMSEIPFTVQALINHIAISSKFKDIVGSAFYD